MTPLKDVEWKQGVLYACAGQSTQLITKQRFKERTGISRDKTVDRIARDCRINFR